MRRTDTGLEFLNADSAFRFYYHRLNKEGVETGNGTKAIFNVGFKILNPTNRNINCPVRKWNKTYAEREWNWYLSKDRSVEEIKKFAPIWDQMHNGDNIVNSNYGYQWNREDQLEKCIQELKDNPLSRRAFLTIFDGKEKHLFEKDTPCTTSIGFYLDEKSKLCMAVHMRSNDIWFGFCNDQYCFSKLQEYVAVRLQRQIGYYYHSAVNLHIYERHYSY